MVVIAHQRWIGADEQKTSEVNMLIIVFAWVILGIAPFVVYWNYRQSMRGHEFTPDYVMSVIPHEYVTTLVHDNYLG